MFSFDVNLLAVLVAAIAHMVVGFIWYSKFLFASAWIKAMELKSSDLKKMHKGEWKEHLGGFIGALFIAFSLAVVLNLTLIVALKPALYMTFFLWLGFMFPKGLTDVLYQKKPVKVFWINSLYFLASMLVMAAILVNSPF